MSYIGNTPAEKYTSLSKQDLTGDGTAGPYTLDYAVGGNAELEIFVNNVRQEPSSAYSVAGNQLTMTGNVASTDDFYVVFQGKSVGTISPPDGSVTSAKLDTNIAISGNLDVGTIRSANGTTAATIDSSGRVLQPAKPAWRASIATNQVVNISANTIVNWTALDFDIGNNFDLSNNYYTVAVTGLYHINTQVALEGVANSTNTYIYVVVNGSGLYIGGLNDPQGGNNTAPSYSSVHQFTAGDEISIQARAVSDTSCIIRQYTSYFSGYLVG